MKTTQVFVNPRTPEEYESVASRNGARNMGWRHERIPYNPREMAFAKEWERENKKPRSLGEPILTALHRGPRESLLSEGTLLCEPTNRERCIVATIIQWLGSNVGFAWLERTLNDCGYSIVPIPPERWNEEARKNHAKYERRTSDWWTK